VIAIVTRHQKSSVMPDNRDAGKNTGIKGRMRIRPLLCGALESARYFNRVSDIHGVCNVRSHHEKRFSGVIRTV